MKFAMTKIAAGLVLAVVASGAQAVTVTSMTVADLGTVWTGGSAHIAANIGTGTATGTSGGTFYFRGSLFAADGSNLAIPNGANSQDGFDAGGTPTTGQAIAWGSTGLGIINGTTQTTFGGTFDFGGPFFTPNSNGCTPTGTCVTGTPAGTVVGGKLAASTTGAVDGLTIDLGDFGGFFTGSGSNFRLNPNTNAAGLPIIRTSALGGNAGELGADKFYYSIDWLSTISSTTGDVSNGATGFNNFTADWHLEGVGTVAAIPEASTYGMMLAGLGLVGFAVRRRNQA